MTLKEILDYEIRSSWWASFIWFKWGQELAGIYFANKASRKYKRYLKSKKNQRLVNEMLITK